ncbi:MAG: hypothetical protein JSS07_06570 [Proteobacteria bacterium]|nr:hypothetical protein [Pseudomonadota bacterium]
MMNHFNIGVIVAARLASKRLPGKALLPMFGLPMLGLLLHRLKSTTSSVKIVLATTKRNEDKQLCSIANEMGYDSFQGDENDLVARYVDCANFYNMDYVVRVTGDCPFVDGPTLDFFLKAALNNEVFSLATTKGCFPVGIDFELFTTKSMQHLHETHLTVQEREHLTLHYYQNSIYPIKRIYPPQDWKNTTTSFTIDTEEDYKKAILLTKDFKDPNFSVRDLINNDMLAPV